MQSGRWIQRFSWKSVASSFRNLPVGGFCLGIFLGAIVVSMAQQWFLTFGQDAELSLISIMVVSLGIALGSWRQKNSSGPGHYFGLIACLAAWAMIHPFWIEALTNAFSVVSILYLKQPVAKWMMLEPLALAGWLIPSVLLSRLFLHLQQRSVTEQTGDAQVFTVLLGFGIGLIADAVWVSAWLGIYLPAVVASMIAVASAWKWPLATNAARITTESPEQTASPLGTRVLALYAMIALLGTILACNLRLSNQLLPHSPYVSYVQLAGILLGASLAWLLPLFKSERANRVSIVALLGAAVSVCLLALQGVLVSNSIWLNASLTTVTWLLMARILMLLLVAAPFGFCLMVLAAGSERSGDRVVRRLACLISSYAIANYLLAGTVSVAPLFSMAVLLLLVIATAQLSASAGTSIRRRRLVFAVCSVVVVSMLPWWQTPDNPARTAKLLFSTPAFMAYRSGWEIEDLPYLDDIRMMESREGAIGPMTLWRGKVAELYIRDSGVPRAVVTKSADIVPQFAPEVLQAVLSMVISDRPDRVLFLGLSGGVPLATCLNFPVREMVCVEGDSQLINLVRGPLARETGLDPCADDRVTLHQISPELALMGQFKDRFDVILCNPVPSSLTGGAACFTQEYYQRASRQLSERGLFCQRVECIDYGPKPIQLIVKTMQSAFTTVIGIEAGIGELLLFGANSDSVFIPTDLATRLEAKHVCKVLARSGIDWSALLNLPAYDSVALAEISEKFGGSENSTRHGQLSATAPLELMRWGNKRQECLNLMNAQRMSMTPYPTTEPDDESAGGTKPRVSLCSNLALWLGDEKVSKELMRRLGEVTLQQKLIRENPDAHWWSYRKTLRQQLQQNPRTSVQQVKAIDESKDLHPEDVRRKAYFTALGNAARQPKPTRDSISELEQFLDPYDPLISLFARQETADLLARAQEDAGKELEYRMHVIYFAPPTDASVRNVATAIETLVAHPETIPDPAFRFDALNGLLQTLRVRWEVRQSVTENSARKILTDVDQSLLAVEKGVSALDELAPNAGIPAADWAARKQVFERLMQRPLRTYRTVVQTRVSRGEAHAKALIDEVSNFDDDDDL